MAVSGITLPRRRASRASSWSLREELFRDELLLLRRSLSCVLLELEEDREELSAASAAGAVSAIAIRNARIALRIVIAEAIVPEVAAPI
jgi:hypothetical protein